jgi:cobalt-zinc-cadmium efflux system membrane fusion protein
MKMFHVMLLMLPLLAALAGCERKHAADESVAVNAGVTEDEWCAEHGVPESICTRCHPNLIAAFKQKGDWCKEHQLPESQCTICDPNLKDTLDAMKPKDAQ